MPVYDEPVDVVEPTVAAAVRCAAATCRVRLLDDGARAEMARDGRAPRRRLHGRSENTGAKAGNLNNALRRTPAPYVRGARLRPRPQPASSWSGRSATWRTRGVAFVQTPQYYANGRTRPDRRGRGGPAGPVLRPDRRGKDGWARPSAAAPTCVFRREALEDVGGFPEHSVTEDFELSVRMHERGWRSAYVPEVLACGLGPEDMASYVSQQQRWARGCLGAIGAVAARPPAAGGCALQYLLSATYFLSGWTLVVYMSLAGGADRSSARSRWPPATADQFLLHFAPYYCGALATVAMAGVRHLHLRRVRAGAGSFWIHVQATFSAMLRRAAGFVVTPKEGTRARQPRAVLPDPGGDRGAARRRGLRPGSQTASPSDAQQRRLRRRCTSAS